MVDQFGRRIEYMRLSITDRCNLRCQYCMPNGITLARHCDLLTYEEMLRICKIAVKLGVSKFKITGGEPLVRLGCINFIRNLKELPGVKEVTLTTNGLLLPAYLEELKQIGIDGINISLDTLDDLEYRKLTGYGNQAIPHLLTIIQTCLDLGIKTKINTVLLADNLNSLCDIAGLAKNRSLDVRFIELMPIGEGAKVKGITAAEALARLKVRWNDLHPTSEKRGNGPASYYRSKQLQGRIGFIHAVSQQFCNDCNRIRLTSSGILKPCLCYEQGKELAPLLRGGVSDLTLMETIAEQISLKPRRHCFSDRNSITEHKVMSQIGG